MSTAEQTPLGSIDFDDLSLFADGPPHELFRRLREESPVHWSEAPERWPASEGPGYWNVTRAADIVAISRDPATFSSWQRGFNIRTDEIAPLEMVRTFMIGKDPPEHTRMRGVVNNAFTPRRVRSLEDKVRGEINGLIDQVIERGECDLIADVAAPYPLETIADLLGVPDSDRERLFHWTDSILAFDDPELSAHGTGEQAMNEAGAYLLELIADRERNPRDDLVTALGRAEYEGMQMPEAERAGVFIQLFAAGADTLRGTLGLGVQALIDHPDQRQALIDDPGLMARGAVEEILRWTTVAMYMRRTATRDTEVRGQPVAEGDSVVMWLASGSRDPEAIEDPDAFDVRRPAKGCPHHASRPGLRSPAHTHPRGEVPGGVGGQSIDERRVHRPRPPACHTGGPLGHRNSVRRSGHRPVWVVKPDDLDRDHGRVSHDHCGGGSPRALVPCGGPLSGNVGDV